MYKQMRTINLKFILATLFAIVFLVGGFFINTTKVSAQNSAEAFPYTLSSVSSYPNNVGGTTTVVNIGCVPNSGDKYDVNTGTLCPYAVAGAKLGCAFGSGDTHDINTGKRCVYLTSNVFIGCASTSKDLYDINTGKRCINNSVSYVSSGSKTNTVAIETPGNAGTIISPTPSDLGLEEEVPSVLNENSERDNLLASGTKALPLFAWPWNIRTIIVVIFIILVLGYGIYNFTRNESAENIPKYVAPTNTKNDKTTPIVTQQAKPVQPQAPVVNAPIVNKGVNPEPAKPAQPQQQKFNELPNLNQKQNPQQQNQGNTSNPQAPSNNPVGK